MSRLPMIIALLLGLLAGWVTVESFGRADAEGAPPGWSLVEAGVPLRRPELLGELSVSSGSIYLDHARGIASEHTGQALSLTATLPAHGRLSIYPAVEPHSLQDSRRSGFAAQRLFPDAPALVLHRDGDAGGSGGFVIANGRETALRCSGTLPAPTSAPYPVTVARSPTGFSAEAGGQTMNCDARLEGGDPAIRAGLQRVRISSLALDDTPVPLGQSIHERGLIVLATTFFGLLIGMTFSALSVPLWGRVLTAGSVLVGAAALEIDAETALMAVRLVDVPPAALPVLFTMGLPAVLWSVFAGIGHMRARSRDPWSVIFAWCLIVACATVVLGRFNLWMVGAFTAATAALGIVVWANLFRIRRYNLVSFICMCLALGWTEYGLRFTATAQRWVPVDEEGDPLLDEFTVITGGWDPQSRRPVQLPRRAGPRQTAHRIAVFGGSTTAGAFNQPDLAGYYPAHIDRSLGPDVEVVNQGVAGWSTFHIRHHLAHALKDLDAQLIVLYIGYNDRHLAVPAPYAELFETWKAGGLTQETVGALQRVRLYQALKFLIIGMLPAPETTAVPAEHTLDNLLALAATARAQGVQVLVVPEATWPDTGDLDAHKAAMKAAADDATNLFYVDTAAPLMAMGERMFLDDCHLTEVGHRATSGLITQAIRSVPGWHLERTSPKAAP